MTFLDYLTESKESKNVHLTHLEDHILEHGMDGARESLAFLISLRNMLTGSVEEAAQSTGLTITTKWDGAPAIVLGQNPENNKFFVGTKAVFAQTPKINYTPDDIDRNHPGEGLNDKLKLALLYLKKLHISGILQGDLMFTRSDLKTETIDGQKMVTFQPNTIVYAVPKESALAKTILAAQIGIVFHTAYVGSTMNALQASYTVDVNALTQTKDVWFRDASLNTIAGGTFLSTTEQADVKLILSTAGSTLKRMSTKALNEIALSPLYQAQVKQFINAMVKQGTGLNNSPLLYDLLIKRLDAQLSEAILDAKKEDTRKKRVLEKMVVMRFYKAHREVLLDLFRFMYLITTAKMVIVRKLQQLQSMGTFLKTETGFTVTNPEGFVAVSQKTGQALKLIDRLEFSRANFTTTKDWSK